MKTLNNTKPTQPMYPNAILVTLILSGGLLSIQTTDRDHGRSQRFLAQAHLLQKLVDGALASHCDNDLHNFLKVFTLDREHLCFHIWWLRETGSRLGTLEGCHQSFVLPTETLRRALAGEEVRCMLLDRNGDTRCPISLAPSGHEVVKGLNKRERRALAKALSRSFRWRFDAVELMKDWERKSFFFRSSHSINGGFILSSCMVTGRDGKEHEALSYSVHT